MKETQRIVKLFEAGYDGSPWIDVNLVNTLRAISITQALKKLSPSSNSIWEITNHLISWRENVLQRVQGKTIKTPAHNYFIAVKNGTSAEWQATMKKLEATQNDWILFLKTLQESAFEQVYEPNEMSYYEHIQGILQHDAYHLGQIVMIVKIITSGT
jgi:uncharacterized damage-inducible protein DinB